jgi:hypothetical protein
MTVTATPRLRAVDPVILHARDSGADVDDGA